MNKRFVVLVPVLVTSVCLAYFIYLLGGFVYTTLYDYGLQVSSEWANSFWATLRYVQVLLVLNIVFSIAGLLYLYVKSVESKHTKIPRIVETSIPAPKVVQTSIPAKTITTSQKGSSVAVQKQPLKPQLKPEVERKSDVNGGLAKCNHCGKEFAQPLRMLDFHEDPPRMISVCPFCSEVMVPPSAENEERKRKSPFRQFYLEEKK